MFAPFQKQKIKGGEKKKKKEFSFGRF